MYMGVSPWASSLAPDSTVPFCCLEKTEIVRMTPAAFKNILSRACTEGFIPDRPGALTVKISSSCCQVNSLKFRHGIFQELLYLYAELLTLFAWVWKPFLTAPWQSAMGFPLRAVLGRAVLCWGEDPWSSKEPGSSLVSHLACSGHTRSHSD